MLRRVLFWLHFYYFIQAPDPGAFIIPGLHPIFRIIFNVFPYAKQFLFVSNYMVVKTIL